jgi:hypothetical protein
LFFSFFLFFSFVVFVVFIVFVGTEQNVGLAARVCLVLLPSATGRTFKDALDAKSDAEWERGFLKKQRYWLACCSFCKLCCISW